jgi:uncharacterized protein YqgC (DUF456 family)
MAIKVMKAVILFILGVVGIFVPIIPTFSLWALAIVTLKGKVKKA